ncbi:MAG: hypothetical protein IJB86_02625 [Clostridia bacterium]|nr:hypothetical protein [Clostridia bacterium]
MKKKFVVRALAMLLSASVILTSVSSGMGILAAAVTASAVNDSASDVSDTSDVVVNSAVVIEGNEVLKASATGITGGSGAQSDPYLISDVNELLAVSSYINDNSSGDKYFRLENDIDLSTVTFENFVNYEDIYALISATPSLSGNADIFFDFDGNGKKLYNLSLTVPSGISAVGIFGYVNSNSAIHDLTFENIAIYNQYSSNAATAVGAVQNHGTISDCSFINPTIDLTSATSAFNSDNVVLVGGKVYTGYAVVASDNNGTITRCSVTANDSQKGIILVKGDRRFIGGIVGQNRNTVSECTVSGLRIFSYGSADSSDWSGSGVVSSYVGAVAGRNNAKANRTSPDPVITDCTVNLSNAIDLVYGDYVGGIAGYNAGRIENAQVNGDHSSYGSAPVSASADMYGFGRYGGIAGGNSGYIVSSGAYDVGFTFSRQAESNAYGGIVGFNSGSVEGCVSTGYADNSSQSAAGVGGVVGNVQSGTSVANCYTFVKLSASNEYAAAVLGKNATLTHLGTTNYWSSLVSGISYAVPFNGVAQNEITSNLSVLNVPVGAGGLTIERSSISHSGSEATVVVDITKNATSGTSEISASNTSTGFRITSNVDGACGEFYYFVNITFPSGVGISGKSVSQRFSVPVIVSSSALTGAGTSISNPILITTYTQLKFIKNAPSAHYKLAADINADTTWEPFAFSGTLDGNGHTINIKTTLFTDVSGTRSADIASDSWKNDPSNLLSGYIHNLKIVATSAINGPVIRNLNNATLVDITYSATTDGFAQLNTSKTGAFVGEINGNVYLNRCYVSAPVSVTSVSSDGIAALVGYVSANNFIIDNCGTSSIVAVNSNINKVAGLIGFIAAVSGKGIVSNNYATGSVHVTSSVANVLPSIMIGAIQSMTNLTLESNYYSVALKEIAGYSVSLKAAPVYNGINEFDFADGAYDVLTDMSQSVISLTMPTGMYAVSSVDVSDFEINFASSEVSLVSDSVSASGNTLTFSVVASTSEEFSTYVTVKHIPTGFTATTTLRSGLRLVGGYFEIYTVADLQDIAEGFNDPSKASTYMSANYKLCADLDLTGETLPLMAATAETAFTGSFVGADNGDSKYTISNMTITGTKTAAGASAVGLFCYANGAVFSNFALHNVTVNNPGTGSGLVVGYADTDSATSCKFNNIDIDNCTVNSTYTGGNTIALTNMAEAGSLVGSVRSTSSDCDYEFRNITVTDTTVKNANTGGSYAIGGLIGSSCVNGTLVIGTPEAETESEPSIVIDGAELDGYGFMGGIIGIAGGLPNATSTGALASTATGGIAINNVIVRNSSIPARQGYSGGILGTEGCVAGGAKIINSKVENTTVSAGATAAVTSTVADAGGIAGHMAGLIENCTVDSCTLKSCFAGGILGRSSRRGNTDAGTLVTIKNCNVIGDTEITDNGVGTANELGGIIANARTCSALIEKCGVGTDVYIHGTAVYAGGIMGACLYTSTTTLYDVTIKDSVTYATVELENASTTAAAGGIIGLGNMNVAFLDIINCVSAGEVNCNGGYCAGVIGFYNRTAKGTTANSTLIVNCTVTALLNVNSNGIEGFTNNANNTAKLVGRTGTFNANYWMGNTLTDAVYGNVVSSYPQDIRIYGYAGSYDLQTRNTEYVDTFTDVNKPNGNYVNGTGTGVVIDGSVSTDAEVVISNEASVVGFDDSARLVFDTTSDDTLLKYNGWNSVSNGILVVTGATVGTADTDAVVSLTAKKNSTSTGFVGSYSVTGFTVPGTEDKVLVQVMVPVICQNISAFNLDGSGTESDPYVIMTKDDLDSVRFGSSSAYYVLGADIEFVDADFAEGGFFYNNGTFFSPISFTDSEGNAVPFTGSFSGYYNDTLYYLGGVRINSSSADAGLFAVSDGADFSNLYLDNFSVTSSTGNAGVVVGTASNTSFSDVQIYSSTVKGSVYAGTVAAYVTDTDADKITVKSATLSTANYIGGLFGHAKATSNTAVNEITNSNLTDITVSSVSTGDTVIDIAAGIVGEFSGRINNVTVNGTGSISGSRASGAVGRVGFEGDSVASDISTVTVDGTYTVVSTRALQKATAAGIVAKINDERADEQESDDLTVNLTVNNCYVGKNVDISAFYYAGGVIGSAESWKRGSVKIENTKTFADVTASGDSGKVGFAGGIVGLLGGISVLSIDGCVASGNVTAAEGAGGVIGVLYDYDIALNGSDALILDNTASAVSDTVVSAKIAVKGIATAPVKGIIVGSVSDEVIPTGLSVIPFNNIYYSSYQISGTGITGNDAINNSGYDVTVCNLQENFQYTDGTDVLASLPISGDGLLLETDNILIGENGQVNTGAVTGNYRSFTVSQDVNFVLEDVLSVDSLGQPKDLFAFDGETFMFTLVAEGSGLAAFRYDNGLELTLNVTSFDIDGAGSADDPYIIKNVSHLLFVNDYPNKCFVLGADIDFATDENGSTWPDAWFEREAMWSDAGITFSGSFSGTYFEYDEETGEYTDVEKTYAVRNLTIESDTAINVGFFSTLVGSVSDIIFDNCTFISTAANSNAGAVAGTNNGSVSGVVVSGSTASAVNSAGSVVGYSTAEISSSKASSTTVSANHAAGGIAGTSVSVTDCEVASVTVNATDYAGGVAASNISGSNSASVFSDCTVSDTTVTAQYISAGILAMAEEASGTGNRGLTVENCIVNRNVTMISTGKSASTATGKYYSYSAGIIGFIGNRYDSITVRTNESYASVTANGDVFTSNSEHTSAGAIVGSTGYATTSRPSTRDGELRFTFVNNVAGGVIRSANYAGGIAGRIAFQANQAYRIKTGDFICHNIISAVFESVVTASGTPGTNDNFALVCSFIESNNLFNPYDASTVSNNYYSSYTSKVGNPLITPLGPSSEITSCELIDVATDSDGASSFKVKNNRYEYSAYEVDENGEYVRDEKGFLIPIEDPETGELETIGIVSIDSSEVFFEDIVIGYHFDEYQESRTYTKPIQFIFGGSDTDLGILDSEFTVYSSNGVERAISISGLSISPLTASSYYTCAVSSYDGRIASEFTVILDEETEAALVADLGYGLKVGINISASSDGSVADGSISSPYIIKDAADFAYYFFGAFATNVENDYLRKYYRQTADISFNDIVAEIAILDPATAVSNTFAPIGNVLTPFRGGYDGNEKIISDFTYLGTDDDTGLFGYVEGASSSLADYRLRDIHIELAPGGVSGGTNTGGLVGRYNSDCEIYNCSVVYSTVIGSLNVGGLVGNISDTTLNGCFTSTDVRVHDETSNNTDSGVGGIAGFLSTLSTTEKTLSFVNCFSSSDAVAYQNVSGFIGKIYHLLGSANEYGKINLDNCSFTGSVTAMRLESNATTNDPISTSIVIGHFSTGATGAARMRSFVTANNVVVAGTNTTEYATSIMSAGDTQSKIYYPVLFGTAPLVEGNNVYYDASVIGRITVPNNNSGDITNPYQYWVTGDLYDITGTSKLGVTSSDVGIINSDTENLLSMTSLGDSTDWDCSDAALYPVVRMRDEYSDAFSKMSSVPFITDEREADDVDDNSHRDYTGLTYPLTVAKTVDGNTITLTASTYSAASDTVPYDANYDLELYGNGGTTRDSSDMKTDILFKDSDNGVLLLRNSYLDSSSTTARDEKSPYVKLSATVDGYTVNRNVRIPLRGEENAVFIATERQLRAIMNSRGGIESSGKFYNAYNGALTKNVYLCADIDLNENVKFAPISGYGANSRFFDGSNCIVSDLYIDTGAANTGFFDVLQTNNVEIKNIVLRNVNVNGLARTGALVGYVSGNVLFNNCLVITDKAGDYKVSGTIGVGGLIGWMEAGFIGYKNTEAQASEYTPDQVSGASVPVYGTNFAGGFVGYAKGATISNSFASGDVYREYNPSLPSSNYFSNGTSGFGGFVGYAELSGTAGRIQYTFASGSILADYAAIDTSGAASGFTVGVGGFAGIAKMPVQNCFSSGDVHSTIDNISSTNGVNFGIGGLVGYSDDIVNNAYSSSVVEFALNSGMMPTLAGVGGVVGISTGSVEYVYSSGSIWSSLIDENSPVKLGGVVGNADVVDRVYFDTWTNNIESLKAVGNVNDADYIRGFTTEEFCNGTLVTGNYLTSAEWGYDKSDNPNAYPYLKEFCKDHVSDYVRYPAVLSVVAVRPNDRDEAVREGRGYSMALTMPTSLTMDYINAEEGVTTQRIYNLEWAAGSELGATDGQFAGGLIKYGNNTFAPIRTSNTEQYLQLVAWVKSYEENGVTFDNDGASDGYKEFGTREISKLYQMMLGTEEYPYLISTSLDLRHIGFNVEGNTITNQNDDYGQYPDFYDRWYSPINIENLNENVEGKVYYKLISNVDMTKQIVINGDGTADVVTVPNSVFPTIPSMEGNQYPGGINFSGLQIDGDDYAIVNFVSDGSFINSIDSESDIKNLIFDNVMINAVTDAAIIGTNGGTVDGLMVMGGSIASTNGNTATVAAVNNGTIINCISDVSVTGSHYVGGIVAENNGTITLSVSDSDLTASGDTLGIGGIAGRNAAEKEISQTISLGSVTGSATSYTGGFVGVNEGAVIDSYSRTKVSGTFPTTGSFAGNNTGTVKNAFSAGKTVISGTTVASKGSAFVGENSGTLQYAYADKALLTSDAYMLIADAATTEDIISGVCFGKDVDKALFTYCADGNNAYPQITALAKGDPEEAEDSETADGYEMIKYRMLEAYSVLATVTVDSAYANYIDLLAPANNKVSVVPTGYSVTPSGTITSGNGTLTATAPAVSQKIGAGTNTQDDITYNLKYSFDYAVTTDGQNPNFTDGVGSESDPYIIATNGNYTAESSFESLAYYGMANDASFKMAEDVSFDGNDLYVPIERMSGTFDGNGYTVNDVTVNSNSALIGEITGSVKNLGITGIIVNATDAESGLNFGLLAGKATGAAISNVYAVGELKVAKIDELSSNVGGLVGYLDNSTVSSVVTSGYIRNDCIGADSTVGGIAGFVDGGSLGESESTAYVFGDITAGGIAGKVINTEISEVIYAGTVADTVLTTYGEDASTDTTVIGQIVGSGTASEAYYDKQVALFTDDSANARSTSQLVRLNLGDFTNDTDSMKYYPNPISVTSSSDAFKAGLNFALARINVSIAGGEGALNCYDQVSVTSPVHKTTDTVSMTEDRTRFGDTNSYMTVSTSSSLLPNGGSARGFTAVRATLNDGVDSSYEGNVNDIYRYVEVYIVRVIEIDYVLIDNTAGDVFGNDTNVGLMIRPDMDGALKITSNAVTSINEDADTSSGSYTVKFNKIVVSGGGFTVDTLLPEGFDFEPFISASDEASGYSGSISETDGNYVELGETDKVKLYVAISEANEVWGLQSVNGGLE